MYGGAGGPPAAGYGAGRAGQAPGYGPYPPAPHYYRLPPAYPNTTTSTPPPSHHHLYRPHLQGIACTVQKLSRFKYDMI